MLAFGIYDRSEFSIMLDDATIETVEPPDELFAQGVKISFASGLEFIILEFDFPVVG